MRCLLLLSSAVRRLGSGDQRRAAIRQIPAMNIAVVCPYCSTASEGSRHRRSGLVERLRGEGHAAWLVAPGRSGAERARRVGSTVTISANRSTVPVALGLGVPGRVRRALGGADLVHVHEPLDAARLVVGTRYHGSDSGHIPRRPERI